MTDRPFVVVSGLPGSGKTTLAAGLATALNLPLLDKDDILEALFEGFADVDVQLRQQLSRASDLVLAKVAARSAGAVIVSFWRHEASGGESGTPTAWLKALSPNLVEVHCDCPVEVAEQRFRARQRHSGHNDAARSAGLHDQLERLSALGPLGMGPLVRVATDAAYDIAQAADEVRTLLAPKRPEAP